MMKQLIHTVGRGMICMALVLVFFPDALSQVRPDATNGLIAPLPDPLSDAAGHTITSVSVWEAARRSEVLELFRDHVYGHVPEMEFRVQYRTNFLDMQALGGTAVMKEVEVQLHGKDDTVSFTILIFLPSGHDGPVPLFLGLNFNGNQSIHPDPRISLTRSWVDNNPELGITEHRATEASRGYKASRWPVEMILSRGYGVATVYAGDLDPDVDDGFRNGVHRLDKSERDASSWGTISAWAWGLSRCMDYFEKDADIDASRVAVIGHSRLGKTALWAGAQDPRFAMVVSNNSGCGGAALSRRPFGERVSDINGEFPHWFDTRFHSYGNHEADCPVDQHMLLALVAPRPLYVASAAEDDWADPPGEYLSLCYGSSVYALYGYAVLDAGAFPSPDQPVCAGRTGYHIRSGKHDITRYDWEQYLDFADRQLGPGSGSGFENPVTLEWIRGHLNPEHPRLLLTPEGEALLREKLDAGNRDVQRGLQLLRERADKLLDTEPLVFHKTGKRLLGVSREALGRLTTLAFVYRMERDPRHLERLERELRAVCTFPTWNPSHYLDVGEMAAGVALVMDWAGEWISPEVMQVAEEALVKKALIPGVAVSSNNFFTGVTHNWNLVCNGGLSLAALAVFEKEPELASRILYQAVETIPLALGPYAPEGIYPEGASYWFYATTYLTVAISAFESALGTDFGFTEAHGLLESALFSRIMAAPSGDYYNFFDASLGGYHSLDHFGLLAWFANRSGEGMEMDAYRALIGKEMDEPRQIRGSHYYPFFLLELAQLDGDAAPVAELPGAWVAAGDEPVGIFRDTGFDPEGFFLAAKGGQASDNHGNMDAGSFIFELDGVRWSVDPGNQDYNELEQLIGESLWDTSQESARWSLLTKNNFGHSTLTVNGHMHRVDARARLLCYDLRSAEPSFTFDLSAVFGDDLEQARRTFTRTGDRGLLITDALVTTPLTRSICWQMVTTAEVTVLEDGVILEQDGKRLSVKGSGDLPFRVEVVSLSPPPLVYDKDIPGLKRIGFRLEDGSIPDSLTFGVRLEPVAGSLP
jgi:hypothetical protein